MRRVSRPALSYTPFQYRDQGVDPYFDAVVLLLNGDSLFDQSRYRHRPRGGTALSISTSQQEYGAGCIKVSNVGSPLYFDPSPLWDLDSPDGGGNWTIEARVQQLSYTTQVGIVMASQGIIDSSSMRGWTFGLDNVGAPSTASRTPVWCGVPEAGFTFPNVRMLEAYDTLSDPPTGWHEICVQKAGTSNSCLWVDGAVVSFGNPAGGGTVINNNTSYGGHPLSIGASIVDYLSARGDYLIQRLRITRGVGRYTIGSSYTVPTGPLPIR